MTARCCRPSPRYWTTLQRDQWTYPIQDHDWKGWTVFRDMLEGMWAARGDTLANPNPNVPALRSFFLAHFDVDKMLTYLAVLNWMTPWDDTTQNYFLWQRVNGNWSLLPWDMDAMFGDPAVSIFAGEVGDRSNTYRGPNYFKDSFIKAFRAELKQRLFLLNNTLLLPGNLAALGFPTYSSYASARFTSVNQQCGLGVFTHPTQPVNLWPSYGDTAAWPANLVASPYSHTASPAPAQATTTWEIRATNSTYAAPVFKLNSATNLTTLPIPFTSLTLGATYFWRCTYFDTNGHPSLASVETAFVAGPVGPPPDFALGSIQLQPGAVELRFCALPGLAYRLEYSDSLTQGCWTTLTNVPAQASALTVLIADTPPIAAPARFYRLVTP